MQVTISTHVGSAAQRQHNIRNAKTVDRETHITKGLPYEIWIDENPIDAYERIFGEYVREYNEKQTREERKIKSYYEHIKKDAKKKPVYEMIIGIYARDDNGKRIQIDEELSKKIMRKFVDDWKRRNPNFEIIGAYYHADEEGSPHVHIDYIPIAHGYTRGLRVQNGLVRALQEMGFEAKQKSQEELTKSLWEKRYSDKTTVHEAAQWIRTENDYLEKLCRERGLTVIHPQRDGQESVKHYDTLTFKAKKQAEKWEVEAEAARERFEKVSSEYFQEVLKSEAETTAARERFEKVSSEYKEKIIKIKQQAKKKAVFQELQGEYEEAIENAKKEALLADKEKKEAREVLKLKAELEEKSKRIDFEIEKRAAQLASERGTEDIIEKIGEEGYRYYREQTQTRQDSHRTENRSRTIGTVLRER